MKKKVGFGVIGTGFWGKNHARVLSELKETNLIAVCDTDADKAQSIAKRYNVNWYTRNDDLLKREDIEAVCICTPTTTHSKIALKTIEYGKHLLIEKPMANTAVQAKKIIEEIRKNQLYLMVGFIERFNPGLMRVKKLIESGVLGEIVLAFSRRVGKWPERIGDMGVVKDSAIHDLDIMRFLFEEDPLSVYARAGSLHHQYEDYAQIVLSFSGIKTAFVEANWFTPHKVRIMTLTGSKAIVNVDYITQEITIEDIDKAVKPKREWDEPLKLELEHFANCVSNDKCPEVSGLDGLRALQISEAALISAKTGKVIQLLYDDTFVDE
ncbi:MAG: Gfo/Idh/MocA family oxidoreductase [Candidatus Bathyarchaeota archaeon]|nr:MAG: Gfo/Idh/MocA family oxidoreductase [Candidatus Bathyarchaeota archaeon]